MVAYRGFTRATAVAHPDGEVSKLPVAVDKIAKPIELKEFFATLNRRCGEP